MGPELLTKPNCFGVRSLTSAGWVAVRAPLIAKLGLEPESTKAGDRYDGWSWNALVSRFGLPERLKTCRAEELLEWLQAA